MGKKLETKTKLFHGLTKAVNDKKKTADVIMSDESLDRDRDIILVDAWAKHLPTFMKHPVLLDSHRMGSNADVLGAWSEVEALAGEGLVGKATYFVDQEKKETPDKNTVRWAWVLVRSGLGAYSVQFIIHKGIRAEELHNFEGIIPDSVLELEPDRVFTETELLETSQVPVPANPSALLREIDDYEEKGENIMLAVAKGVFDKGLLIMPKKTFIMPSYKDSLEIKVEVDDIALLDLAIRESKNRIGFKESELAELITFTVKEIEPETEKIVPVEPEVKEALPVDKLVAPEIEPLSAEEFTEEDLEMIEKAFEVHDENEVAPAEEITEEEMAELEKAFDSEAPKFGKTDENETEAEKLLKICEDVFQS